VRAHNSKVNSIRKIEIESFNRPPKDSKLDKLPMQSLGLISTSDDKHVKVWSTAGVLLGDINLVHEKVRLDKWDFKFDWAKAKRNQMRKVRSMVKQMQQQEITGKDLATIEEHKTTEGSDVDDSEYAVSDSFEDLPTDAYKMRTMNDLEKVDSKRLLKKLLPEYSAKHNEAKLVHGMGGYYRMEAMDRNGLKGQ
jgi:hypothetical protein